MSEAKGSRYDPRWHGPNEIVPELDTPMVDLEGNFVGTLGQIWERDKYRDKYRDVEVARREANQEKPENDARKAQEAAANQAAQEIAYAEYEEREGRPHPLFAGTVATAETVEQTAAPAQEHVSAPALVREAALAR